MRPLLLTLLLLSLGALAASRFAPTIAHVEVNGNENLTREEVLELAGIAPGDPFLWVTAGSVRALAEDPWVARLRILRHWPDVVSLRVWEREPILTDGERAWAADGTLLPDVPPERLEGLVRLEGWGPERVAEALELAALLAPFSPQVISYTPEGFDIRMADGTLSTPSVDALRRQWPAFTSQRGIRTAVYPWGVSTRYD